MASGSNSTVTQYTTYLNVVTVHLETYEQCVCVFSSPNMKSRSKDRITSVYTLVKKRGVTSEDIRFTCSEIPWGKCSQLLLFWNKKFPQIKPWFHSLEQVISPLFSTALSFTFQKFLTFLTFFLVASEEGITEYALVGAKKLSQLLPEYKS